MNTENIINYINERAHLYQEVLNESKKIVNQINSKVKYPLDIYGDEPYVKIEVEGLDKQIVINPVKVKAIAEITNCTIDEAITMLIEKELKFEEEQI